MKKFLTAVFTAMACCAVTLFAACVKESAKQPQKLKDGTELTLTEGESSNIDLSEYISIDGTGYVYTVNSSAPNIATVSVDGNIAAVKAVAEGTATVSAAAGEVSVEFTVKVNKKQPSAPETANKTALVAELALEVTEQGDYTDESYEVYTQKLQAAKTVNAKADATQTEVDTACNELKTAREGLALRVPEEVDGAEKTLVIVSGLSREITVSDYIDAKNLSSLSYEASSSNALVTVGEIEDGKFTVTAGATEEDVDVALNICANYKGESKLTVTITLQVKSEVQPVIKHPQVTRSVDVYALDNKNELTIDFTENVESNGVENLVYSVTREGATVTLDGNNRLTYNLDGSYSEAVTEVEFLVTVSYGDGKSVDYAYTLKITDTSVYRVANGGFETGDLTGWTLSNQKLGAVSDETHYWKNDEESAEGYVFGLDGSYMFSAYADGAEESASGTLISSEFIIGGSGFITFKIGGAKNTDYVYVDVIEKDSGDILGRFGNALWQDRTDGAKSGCSLIAYKADLSAHLGKTAYIRISDNASTDYGLFFADSFETYYPEAPESGFNDAAEITERPATIYDVYNGGFEKDLSGWTLSGGEIGIVTTDKSYWNDGDPESVVNEYGKEGDKLFSWWSWDSTANEGAGAEVNREGNMGTLTSSIFVLQAGKYVSFKFGGGGNRNVFIELVNAESGSIIAVFRNDNINDGKLISYSYKVDEISEDTLCFFRIVDNAVSGWGCFAADDFKANLDSAPADSVAAQNHKTEYGAVVNGSFEDGNLDGWLMVGELGAVVDTEIAENWYQTNENTKDGNYLFTFHYNNGTENVNVEGNTGIVRSSAFILEKNGIISFRFGAAHNSEVYINVYTTGGKLIAMFRNNAYTQDTVMVQYYYQFDNTEEISCYFEVVDNATGDYGCIVMDDFRVNLDAAPENAVLGSSNTK